MDRTASIRPDIRRLTLLGSALLLTAAALIGGPARSQALDPNELDELVAPIALYPDDLLGIILPASTFPLDIVRAARFLDDLEQDPSLEPDDAWDESVIALLNYPEVLRMMNEDLDWTWALGEAVLTDEPAVLAAAQDFRRRALVAGNLNSDDKQIVSDSEGVIEISPADPEVVYVPVYEPREVVVYQPYPVYRYYPIGYPLYYYPYPSGYFWDTGFFWGVTSYFSIGWQTHHLHLYHHTHRLHPYYLNSYYFYTPYYYRTNVPVTVVVNNDTNVWAPRPRRGARPRTLTVEGRDSTVRTGRTATVESQPNVTNARLASGARLGTNARAGQATGSTTTTSATTRRATPSADTSTRRQEPAIGGRVQRSTTGTSAQSTLRSVPGTTNSQSQLRSSRTTAPTPNTTMPPTRVPTTRSSRPTIGSPAPATQPAPATRSAPATPAPATRSAPATRAPATRSAPPPRATAPAPTARSSGARIGSVSRSAPAPRASAPAPAANAPTRSSGAAIGGVARSAPARSSSSSQGTRRTR